MRIRSFAYLTDRHILVAAPELPHALEELKPNLLVYDLSMGLPTRIAIDDSPFVCSFICPSPSPWIVAFDIGIQSDPAPYHKPDPALSVPFFTGRENRMFVITIQLTDGHAIQTFVIFIPSFTLTKQVSTLTSHEGGICFPWEEWGPTGARMMPSPGQSSIWVCYTYGMRFVTSRESETGDTTIYVFDFNPLPIKRAVQRGPTEIFGSLCNTSPTSVMPGAFEDIITTSLPYSISEVSLETNTEDVGKFSAIMCSEDSLIIVSVRSSTLSCVDSATCEFKLVLFQTGRGHREIRILTF